MGQPLDEVYCARVRQAGSHGTWEPDTRLEPGDYGQFRRGVFVRTGSLRKQLHFDYTARAAGDSLQNIESDGIRSLGAAAGGGISDPLGHVLSAKAELTYGVDRADEVLVLTRRGRWRAIDDIDGLLAQMKVRIAELPLPSAVVFQVYETSGGVVGVSSRSTTGFTVGLDARGAPSIAAIAKARGKLRIGLAHAARRAFSLWPAETDEDEARSAGTSAARGSPYTPLFNRVYRVRKRLLGVLGRPELVSPDGYPVSTRAARTDPVDQLYDPSRAEIALEDVHEMSLGDLFEEVTPELLSEEVSAEVGAELLDEDIIRDLTPQVLSEVGVELIDAVTIIRGDVSRVRGIRQSDAEDAIVERERTQQSEAAT